MHTDKEDTRIIYEQYWLHARHVQNERLWFTNIYAIIVAGSFAIMGLTEISTAIKLAIVSFLFILSIIGFCLVYTLRIPFLKFALRTELIAINEFNLKDEYRRFFPKEGEIFSKDKLFDMPDIFEFFYSLMSSITIFLLISTMGKVVLALVAAIIVFIILFLIIYLLIFREYLLQIPEDIKNKIKDE